MKKILLFLGIALLNMSINAVPVTPVQKFTKSNVQALAVQTASAEINAFTAKKTLASKTQIALPATAFKAADKAIPDFNKIAKQKLANSTISMQAVGYGNAKATITPAAGTEQLYYQVGILNGNTRELIALTTKYFPMATVQKYFALTSEILYTALTEPDYATIVDPNIKGSHLPKGKYIYAIMGYAVNGSALADEPSDIAMAQFEITLDGSEYAIKDVNITVGANNQLTVSWSTNTTPIPEGATYEVIVYNFPSSDDPIADSEDITTASWSTPDAVTIANNAAYEVYVNIWDAYGYALGKPANKYVTVGTDPNAPTNLNVIVDDETMKATFTWTNTLGGTYEGNKVYNEVLIKDANGTVFVFDNGYNNTSAETATSEQLPVGNYTWTIRPFYVDANNDWIYITAVNGPDFEAKDVIAPVINSVAVAKTSDTEVYLSIDVTDNALGVTAADMTYNVSGNITLQNARLEENGTLKLSGLVSTKTYLIEITATDPSGNTSEAFDFEFTPVKDEEAPTNLTASIAEENIFDKYVIINVSAEDDLATAEQLVYILTFSNQKVVELNAQNGQLLLEGLSPETAYEITVSVKDLGGNVCENTVKLAFTTLPLIPIQITGIAAFQGHYYTKYQAYELIMFNPDDATDDGSYLDVLFYPESETKVANVYSPGSKTANLRGIYYTKADKSEVEISAESLTVKFIDAFTSQGIQMYEYYFKFEGMGDDGNLYTFEGVCYGVFYKDDFGNWITVTDTFQDTFAPEIWVDEEYYPVEVDGVNAEIMFGVTDGPWFYEFEDCEEIYTDILNLVLEIQTADGTVLASQAAGSIENTPTLDEDGEYYFTASLSGLNPETEYTVYIYAKDEAGNVAEKVAVSFTTGKGSETAIDQVIFDSKANKVLHNGQLIIKRDNKAFNVQGAQL